MRHAVRMTAALVGCSSLLALSACGSETIAIAESDPYYKGAEIFAQRCSGCHTLSVAGAQGSNIKASDKETTDGPNFDQRVETEANVLYALRNGGFSGKIMPQNIVTGDEAQAVARFLAKYAGSEAKNPAAPKKSADPVDEEPTTPVEGGASTTPATTPAAGE